MNQQKNEKKAMLLALGANIIFGFSFMFTKNALGYAGPITILAYRFTIAFILMNLLVVRQKNFLKGKNKPFYLLFFLGLFQPICYFLCENFGIVYAGTAFASVIIALVPILVMLLGIVFLKEKASGFQFVCCVISVAGVLWLATKNTAEGGATFFGIVLLMGAALSSAVYNIISRKAAAFFTAYERTYAMFFMAFILFVILAFAECDWSLHRLIQPIFVPEFQISVLYLGALSSVGAYLMYNMATTHLPASRACIFSNIITVVSMFAGIVFLKEDFDFLSVLASIIILAGIMGVQRQVKGKSS